MERWTQKSVGENIEMLDRISSSIREAPLVFGDTISESENVFL